MTYSRTLLRAFKVLGFVLAIFCSSGSQAQELIYSTSAFIDPDLRVFTSSGILLSSTPISQEAALASLAHDGVSLYAIDGFNDFLPDRLFRIDPATATGTVVGETGFDWNFRSVEYDPSTGILYGMTDRSGVPLSPANLYTLDRFTGTATPIATITGLGIIQVTSLAIDSQGNAFISTTLGPRLYALDLETLQATYIGDLTTGARLNDMAFDRADQLWGLDDDGDVYRIDTSNAVASFRFIAGSQARGLAFAPPPLFADGFESGDLLLWSSTVTE